MRVILGEKSVRLPDEYAMRLIEQGVAEPVAESGPAVKADKAAPATEQADKPNKGRRARTRTAGA